MFSDLPLQLQVKHLMIIPDLQFFTRSVSRVLLAQEGGHAACCDAIASAMAVAEKAASIGLRGSLDAVLAEVKSLPPIFFSWRYRFQIHSPFPVICNTQIGGSQMWVPGGEIVSRRAKSDGLQTTGREHIARAHNYVLEVRLISIIAMKAELTLRAKNWASALKIRNNHACVSE